MALTVDDAKEIAPLLVNLGDFQNLLKAMRANGWTLGSVEYVIDQVFWEEMDERSRLLKQAREAGL